MVCCENCIYEPNWKLDYYWYGYCRKDKVYLQFDGWDIKRDGSPKMINVRMDSCEFMKKIDKMRE